MNDTPPKSPAPTDAERLNDLLADRALFGLDAAETQELGRLLAAAGRDPDDASFDLPAAAVALAEAPAEESLPAGLRSRVIASREDAKPTPADYPANGPTVATPNPWTRFLGVAGTLAAILLISVSLQDQSRLPTDPRAALIATADDLVRIAWTAGEDPSVETGREGDAPYGDVVWSDAAQSGYLRFRGLKPNDPTVEQYQLWVFDEARNADYPVDGGVFDIASEGEVVVPIDAKLPVTRATLFAITVEKPGGVVVSDRSRLPLLAQR